MPVSPHQYVFAALAAERVPHYGYTHGSLVYIAPSEWFDLQQALVEEPLEEELHETLGADFDLAYAEISEGVFETELPVEAARQQLFEWGLVESDAFSEVVRTIEGVIPLPSDSEANTLRLPPDPAVSRLTQDHLRAWGQPVVPGAARRVLEPTAAPSQPWAQPQETPPGMDPFEGLGEPWPPTRR